MKKTIFTLAAVVLMTSSMLPMAANAAAGDVVRPIYSTDILTYMDGILIQGYAIDGKTMICLEDLINYGFSVYYNDEARALFVNKQGTADSGFEPVIERGTVGDIAGYTYETDIRAYINGQEIAAENIGGKLAVCAEDLGDMNITGTVRNLRFEYPAYFMQHTYDDSVRSLYLFSDIDVSDVYEANITGFMEGIRSSDALFTVESEFENDTYTQYIVKGIYRDSSNFEGCNAVRFYKNGRTFNAENALWEYDFIASIMKSGISITEMSFSPDGKYLQFSGQRSKPQKYSLMGSRNVYEEGEYMLDMNTFALIKIDVEQHELPPEPERPVWLGDESGF